MAQHRIIIEPNKRIGSYWKEIFGYRELLSFLVWRDILVKYKQTALGVLWSIIRPLLTLIIFTIVFGVIAKLPSNGVPYPLLVCCAMLPWQFFATTFSESSNSLVSNSNIVTKVYFPRLLIPIGTILVGLLDFFISLVLLLGLLLFYHFVPGWHILFLPLFLFQAVLTVAGIGFYTGALNVKYRDFRYIVPFLVQIGSYISPVGFSSMMIKGNGWKILYNLNPMVGVIDGFRWAILGGENSMFIPGYVVSMVVSLLIFGIGINYFIRHEKSFADHI